LAIYGIKYTAKAITHIGLSQLTPLAINLVRRSGPRARGLGTQDFVNRGSIVSQIRAAGAIALSAIHVVAAVFLPLVQALSNRQSELLGYQSVDIHASAEGSRMHDIGTAIRISCFYIV
jgi:hypothetical protein